MENNFLKIIRRCIDDDPMEGFGQLLNLGYIIKRFHTYSDEYIGFYDKKRLQKNLKGLAPKSIEAKP
ncbi:hypothetical protein JTT01_05890 [Clostridium botulinum]|nr:hypothetical protein [Clostridium botulinum]